MSEPAYRISVPVFIFLFACVSLAPAPAGAGDDVVLAAMRDELARSLEKLELEELEKPYFIAYRVDDGDSLSASASLGSLLASGENRWRILHVELRVGGYELDNTNFLAPPSFNRSRMVRSFGGITPLPLDDDYREVRRQIWLATDAAYKQAVEDLAKKRAVLKSKTLAEELTDFSREEAAEVHDPRPRAAAELAEMEGLVTGVSALFRQMPEVFTSRVEYSLSNVRSRYVNSEGTFYTRTVPGVRIVAVAATQAEDGMALEDFVAAYGRVPADLPARDELMARIESLGQRLAALRRAPLLERYNGPVLFTDQAAAELLAQAFVPNLIARRRPVVADERMARRLDLQRGGAGFEDRLGARVLPRFLAVTDDPTRAELDGAALVAGYGVDDEGVPAAATALVERGVLKTLLNGRAPVVGVARSSGNRRGGAVVPSNLIVAADRGLRDAELKEELLALVAERGAEFGVVVRRLGNPGLKAGDDSRRRRGFSPFGGESQESAVEPAVAAYRVYADGREELVRNVEISGLTAATFKEIVAAGESSRVFHLPFSPRREPFATFRGARAFGGGDPVVSLAVPSLLFEELTLKKPSGEIPKLPVVERPPAGG